MGLAGIDHAFELSVGQQAVGDDGGRQMRPIAGFRRRDRGHGGRLHQPRRMRRRSGNTDRLKSVSFIERLGDPSALRRRPVHGLIGEFDGRRFDNRRSGPAWRSCAGQRICGRHPRRDWRAGASCGRSQLHGGPRRDQPRHPVEQDGRVVCHARRSRERRRIVGGYAVDDRQARFSAGAVAGIGPAIDGRREHDAAALLQSDEAVAPGGIVGGKAGAGNGDQAAAFGETRQRGREVTQRRVRDPAVDMGGDREGRVHQHDARPHGVVEMVVDVRCVVPRDGDTREQAVEQARARVGEFVQDQAAAREFGVDGKQARCRPKARARGRWA